jgi:1,4-alpha-glucan branching enzyme
MGRDGGNGNLIFVIEPNYTFRLRQFPEAKSVYLAGDFNGWSPNGFPMEKQGDEWVLRLHLSPGKHIYKFVVDGKWILDPDNKLWEQNEFDTGNSVVWVELGGKL